MQETYQDLIEDVSSQIAEELLGEESWLDTHRLMLDEKVFELMLRIGLATLHLVFLELAGRQIEKCRDAGMVIHKRADIDINTRMGRVPDVPSPTLRDPGTGETSRPMKDQFGLRGNGKTLSLERALSDFGSETSYGEAERMFREHYGFDIGRTSILRVTRDVGEDAEEYLETRLASVAEEYGLPPRERASSADELVVQLDGCLIRTGELKTARQAGLGAEDGYEPDDKVRVQDWREVRTGLVRGLDEVDALYACRRGDYQTICDQLFALAVERGLTPETTVVGCGDGGKGLMEAMQVVFARFAFVLDYSHLKGHFYETAEALGLEEDMRPEWVESFIDELWEEDVDDWDDQLEQILGRLRELHQECQNDRLDNLIDYVEKFSDAIQFSRFEDNGWPTGSGEVESAHKQLPQARLKLAGACWRVENLNPMLAMRVLKKNEWWSDFWQWRENQRLAA